MRIGILSLALLAVLVAPVGAQAVGLSQDSLSPTPTAPASDTPATSTPTALPADGGSASWVSSPSSAAGLATGNSYALLAGKLINRGLVNAAPFCNGSSGLLSNGNASPCGEQAARLAVINWQNQFDNDIFAAAAEYNVPAFTLKNMIAQESQFWPTRRLTIYNYYEFGLGSITEMGADTLLRWNTEYYSKICAQVFDKKTCKTDYAYLPADQQAALRGDVLQGLDADCSSCSGGIDLPGAHNSIPTIAATLRANYDHLTWLLKGTTTTPNKVYDSALMWRLTLSSYNAGPGCVTTAVHQTIYLRQQLTWKNISAQFDPGCAGAIAYVAKISGNANLLSPAAALAARADTSRATILVFTTLGISLPTQTPLPVTATTTTTPSGSTPTPSTTPYPSSTPTVTGTPPTVTPSPTGSVTPDTATPSATDSASPEPGTPQVSATPTLTPTAGSLTPQETDSPTATISITPDTATPVDPSQQLSSPHVKNQLVIKIDPNNRQAALDTLKSLGISLANDSSSIDTLGTLVIDVEPAQLDSTLKALQDGAGIQYAEPNFTAQLASLPNDPRLPDQTGLADMQVPQAWDALPSRQEVTVAVLDTGVDASHPDLVDRMFVNAAETSSNGKDNDGNGYVNDWQGWNFVDNNNDTRDTQGHGTHIAGVIGAAFNNSIGIAGVAPNARILPVKVLDNTGFGSYANVAQGIIYATDMGAKIIELGFGGTGSSELLQNAVDYATSHGALVIAAAGNGGTDTPYYPAAYPGVLAVSALGDHYTWAPYSSFGDHISLSAPGTGILSTTNGGGYSTSSGTSMASANVAGVAALLAGQPQFSDMNILRSALIGSALDLGTPGRDPYYGYGAVHAFDALAYVGPVLPTPTPWAAPTSSGTGGVNAMAMQDLWGRTQYAWYSISNPANSIDSSFNNLTASSTGYYGSSSAFNWTFDTFDHTSFPTVAVATLNLRYYITGWVDDKYYLQVYEPTSGCFAGWCTVLVISNPATSGPTTLSVDVSSILNTPAKVNAAQVRLAGAAQTGSTGADYVTFYIDEIDLQVQDVLPPTPTLTPTALSIPTATLGPRAITATPQANEPHNNAAAMSVDACASCHRSHTGGVVNLGSKNAEEQICYACHGAGGPGSNLQQFFTAWTNTSTAYFSHPVSNSANLHIDGENTGSAFGGSNRHVECVDCHAPHNSSTNAASTTNPAPAIQQVMYNSSGVDPAYASGGVPGNPSPAAPTGFTWMDKAQREYQVCFKCHSTFTTLPTYQPDGVMGPYLTQITNGLHKLTSSNSQQVLNSRDMSQEFNPYQPSFHPLMALGRNRNIPAASFVSGWSQNSMVSCSDCHTGGNGPHGSSNLHLLGGTAQYPTTSDPTNPYCDTVECSIHDSGEICFKCHTYETYVNNIRLLTTTHFKTNTENLHSFHNFAACYACHDTHGSEQAHLINFDTSEVQIKPGFNSQTAWNVNIATNTGTCAVACHGFDHSLVKYTP